MTLCNSFSGEIAASTTDVLDVSTSNWDQLYCSHLWSNSNLRRTILNNVQSADDKAITYCYTCKGKMRKYEIQSPRTDFKPNEHSTPNLRISMKEVGLAFDEAREDSTCDDISRTEVFQLRKTSTKDYTAAEVEINRCIPSISRQIDSSIRQKFTSYEPQPNETNPRRLRKSLKGIGCIVNFALTEPVKKRTQIQACSISVMIVAIVVISFVLVNFTTPSSTRIKVISTTVVPTQLIIVNQTSSAVTNVALPSAQLSEVTTTEATLTTVLFSSTTENNSLINNMLSKIRKNIRTYPKNSNKSKESQKRKDIINRDIESQSFCSCQTDEICMLNESTGTPDCRRALDADDPTGCGGLCALETEACQLVDRIRGVRVCRQLSLVTCSPQEWRCRNGLCVSATARCDGVVECYDKSDETHCECDLTKQFRCGHLISCFPNNKLCDGVIDCWDGFDELNCTTVECPEDQFTCTDGQCIIGSRFCDGYADCPDGSDEPRGCDGGCSSHELQCRNRRCVPGAARCDGRDDCGDHTDETDCDRYSQHSIITSTTQLTDHW